MHVHRRRADEEELLDAVVVGIERGPRQRARAAALGPRVEDERGRARADRRVDERAAAEGDGLHRWHEHVAAGRARAALAEGAVHRLARLLHEVLLAEGRALFEEDHVAPGLGELLGDDGAAGAGADDEHLARGAEILGVVGEDLHAAVRIFEGGARDVELHAKTPGSEARSPAATASAGASAAALLGAKGARLDTMPIRRATSSLAR